MGLWWTWVAGALWAQEPTIPEPQPTTADRLVGAYYFPGWERPQSWYCIKAYDQVQHPLLGYYDQADPEAADWHIKWALEHGISFFAFDYYTQGGAQMLESALDDGFLKARFIDRFRFCLNWCNHGPASLMTATELDHFADLVIPKYLTHPSYLRIENKPVVMILAGYSFVKTMGVEGAREAFRRFEQRCQEAGLDGLYLVFCEGEIQQEQDVTASREAGVQAFCLYNYPYAGTGVGGPGQHAEASYADLIEQGERLWKHWNRLTADHFWPTVMPGWDRRPWTKDADLIRTGSTPELFGQALRRARAFVPPYEGGQSSDRVVMIEAWNEWGEGSILEPSVEYGFAYLDQVREVFCPQAGPHQDVDPKSLGLKPPAFDLQLPRIDTWRFDRETEGWTRSGLTEPEVAWGALAATSTHIDPQLTSPVTYLPCAEYGQLTLRMRATPTPPKKGENGEVSTPASATGQLFWSTVEHGLSEEASATFPVPLDGQWHEYTLNLRGHPAWQGLLDRLRLDPVDVGGVRIELDQVRLIP